MITLPLHMRYGEKPLRPAAAWLIPGSEPRIWLDEMLAWGVPLGDAVLYRIPRSARDLSPQGLLVVLPQGLAPRVTHRSQPYAAIVVSPSPVGWDQRACERRPTVIKDDTAATVGRHPLRELVPPYSPAGPRMSRICPSRPAWIPMPPTPKWPS